MSEKMLYDFCPLTPADLDLVNGWIATPHVAQWWTDAEGPATFIDPADFDDADFRMWLVHLDGRPFAYIQDYNPLLYPDHHFFDRKAPVRGIDQFIGDPDMVGVGHGSALVRQRVRMLFAEGVDLVVTDPNPANARAIRAYEKAGFKAYNETVSPKYGPSLLMQCAKS